MKHVIDELIGLAVSNVPWSSTPLQDLAEIPSRAHKLEYIFQKCGLEVYNPRRLSILCMDTYSSRIKSLFDNGLSKVWLSSAQIVYSL